VINAFILDLPLKTGLAMASGLAGIPLRYSAHRIFRPGHWQRRLL
jgi:hypothetical protein